MVGITFSEIVFADGTVVPMKPGDILVLTGPNNGGKSNALRNLRSRVIRTADNTARETIRSTTTFRAGTYEDLLAHLGVLGSVSTNDRGNLEFRTRHNYSNLHPNIWQNELPDYWLSFFCAHLTARERFNIVSGTQTVGIDDAATPMQKMPFNEPKERQISEVTNRSFGVEIYSHIDGNNLSLKTGKRSDFPTRQDWRTPEEQHKVRKLKNLTDEGDGLQSFTAVLMAALVDPKSVTLIDEAEAFLHPPQARRLAQALVQKMPQTGQIIVATHNYDFLRGLVSAGGDRVHVVRMRRSPETVTKYLSNAELKNLWGDPLLYTSDVISALFHDVAVLCEGETDSRFLRAMTDALESQYSEGLPDIRFFSCGSKTKIDKIATALTGVGVPVIAITDCDVLNNKTIVERILSSVNGTVSNFATDYVTLAQAINAASPKKSAASTAADLQVQIDLINQMNAADKLQPLPNNRRNAMTGILKDQMQWAAMKKTGRDAIIPLGSNVLDAFDRITNGAAAVGFFINPHGEQESFWPEGPRNDKQLWLEQVLAKDLATDPDLAKSRAFVNDVLSMAIALKG